MSVKIQIIEPDKGQTQQPQTLDKQMTLIEAAKKFNVDLTGRQVVIAQQPIKDHNVKLEKLMQDIPVLQKLPFFPIRVYGRVIGGHYNYLLKLR